MVGQYAQQVGIGWEQPPPERIGGPPPARAKRSGTGRRGPTAWRNDDRAVLVGLIASVVVFVVYIAFWTNWFTLAGGPKPTHLAGLKSNGDTHPSWGWVMTGVLVGVPIIFVLAFMWRERRSARTQFEALPTDEQERRHQAAALLRQVEPPVDEATAREQLRAPTPGQPPPLAPLPPDLTAPPDDHRSN